MLLMGHNLRKTSPPKPLSARPSGTDCLDRHSADHYREHHPPADMRAAAAAPSARFTSRASVDQRVAHTVATATRARLGELTSAIPKHQRPDQRGKRRRAAAAPSRVTSGAPAA